MKYLGLYNKPTTVVRPEHKLTGPMKKKKKKKEEKTGKGKTIRERQRVGRRRGKYYPH